MKLLEILKHEDALKFSKEAQLALRNGQIQLNGDIVKDNIELDIEDFLMDEHDFFYNYFRSENNPTAEDLFGFSFMFDIPIMFDTIEPWPDGIYKKYKHIIDFLSGFYHLKVSKNKKFILMKK